MQYKFEICDGCHTPLDKEEDIVVCPVCGTPQHRECYNKEHRCVNEEKHAEGFVWQAPVHAPEENTAVAVAETENAPNSQEDSEGNSKPVPIIINPQNVGEVDRLFLNGVEDKPDDELCDGVKIRDAAVFVQNGAKNYIKKFKKIKNKVVSWNWGAFFFAPYWFFYRKMYKLGFAFLGIMIAATVALTPFSQAADTKLEELYNYFTSKEVVEVQEQYKANPNDETLSAKMDEIVGKTMPIMVSVMKTSGIILLATFLVPNTVAALIADVQYRKKMSASVHRANELSGGNTGAARFAILKSGGVSFTAALASILAGMYLPSLFMMIAQALAG